MQGLSGPTLFTCGGVCVYPSPPAAGGWAMLAPRFHLALQELLPLVKGCWDGLRRMGPGWAHGPVSVAVDRQGFIALPRLAACLLAYSGSRPSLSFPSPKVDRRDDDCCIHLERGSVMAITPSRKEEDLRRRWESRGNGARRKLHPRAHQSSPSSFGSSGALPCAKWP
jgi:hypothetical protein